MYIKSRVTSRANPCCFWGGTFFFFCFLCQRFIHTHTRYTYDDFENRLDLTYEYIQMMPCCIEGRDSCVYTTRSLEHLFCI